MQRPDLAEKLCLHRHTDPLWTKEGDSLAITYTSAITIDLRKTLLLIPLVDTQPHTIAEVGNFTDLFKLDCSAHL